MSVIFELQTLPQLTKFRNHYQGYKYKIVFKPTTKQQRCHFDIIYSMHIDWIKLFIRDTYKCTFDISQTMTCNAEKYRNDVYIPKAHMLVSRMNKLIQYRFHFFFLIFVLYIIQHLQVSLHNSTKQSCIFPASMLIIQSFCYRFHITTLLPVT